MKSMNYKSKVLSSLLMVFFAAALITLTSCSDDPDPTFAEPTIVVTPSTVSDLPGATVHLSVAVTADAGLKAVKANGTEVNSYSTATTADAISYDFTIPATAAV